MNLLCMRISLAVYYSKQGNSNQKERREIWSNLNVDGDNAAMDHREIFFPEHFSYGVVQIILHPVG